MRFNNVYFDLLRFTFLGFVFKNDIYFESTFGFRLISDNTADTDAQHAQNVFTKRVKHRDNNMITRIPSNPNYDIFNNILLPLIDCFV